VAKKKSVKQDLFASLVLWTGQVFIF